MMTLHGMTNVLMADLGFKKIVIMESSHLRLKSYMNENSGFSFKNCFSKSCQKMFLYVTK